MRSSITPRSDISSSAGSWTSAPTASDRGTGRDATAAIRLLAALARSRPPLQGDDDLRDSVERAAHRCGQLSRCRRRIVIDNCRRPDRGPRPAAAGVSDDILSRSTEGDADHLGFRIYVPMDVYMEVLPLWTAGLGWELMGTKRFAPSARFQDRVGGGAEMAQVWIRARPRASSRSSCSTSTRPSKAIQRTSGDRRR